MTRLRSSPSCPKTGTTLSSGENLLIGVHSICLIAIYPLDRVIRSLNNRGQKVRPALGKTLVNRDQRRKISAIFFSKTAKFWE